MTIHRPDARPFGGFGLFLDQDGVQPDVFKFQQGAKAFIRGLFLGRLSVGQRQAATGFGTARLGRAKRVFGQGVSASRGLSEVGRGLSGAPGLRLECD